MNKLTNCVKTTTLLAVVGYTPVQLLIVRDGGRVAAVRTHYSKCKAKLTSFL